MISVRILYLTTLITFSTAGTYKHVSFIPKPINKRYASFSTFINHQIPSFSHTKSLVEFDNIDILSHAGFDDFDQFWNPDLSLGNVGVQPGIVNYPENVFHQYTGTGSQLQGFHPNVEIGKDGHITPDYSNGLAYPDPLLLTGHAAAVAARTLYSHELFFGNYPHERALLKQQEIRKENHLNGNKLGSLRPISPFYRYKNPFYSF